VEVRTASARDAERVERIRVRGWQVAYRHVLPPHELDAMPVDTSRWERRLARPPAGWSTFVAEENGRVVGFASVGPSRDEGGIGELYAIYVDPEAWSTGIGRVLIGRAEERLADDYTEATLWVLEENARARRFYEAAGWRRDGARKVEVRWGVEAPEVRYRKRLSSSTSRS
jgi:GNAT superfamily N-acetyltransferase